MPFQTTEAERPPPNDETTSSFPPNTANYTYYRIYLEDGAIPSKTASSGDTFLGRMKTRSVPPPHTVKSVKLRIAKMEDINLNDPTNISLFLTSSLGSPMDDADKINILSRTGPGSTSQAPLAIVAKMSDSQRSALLSERRDGLAEPNTTPPGIRYLYYLLYANNSDTTSKAAFDPDQPSLGRIRADSVAPPHSLASIKRHISRVEENPALASADLLADLSSDAPMEEARIPILGADGPGLDPNNPMAIVLNQMPIVQVENPSILDGRYFIKNRAAEIYWASWNISTDRTVDFWSCTQASVRDVIGTIQWDITHDANNNILMASPYYHHPSYWVGPNMNGSEAPYPWRLIPVDGRFYYLTPEMNRNFRYPIVPVPALLRLPNPGTNNQHGTMATLNEGDHWQMWEFIRV